MIETVDLTEAAGNPNCDGSLHKVDIDSSESSFRCPLCGRTVAVLDIKQKTFGGAKVLGLSVGILEQHSAGAGGRA